QRRLSSRVRLRWAGCLHGAAADVSDTEGRLPCGVRCGGVRTARRRGGGPDREGHLYPRKIARL
ncbi:unnamed protein product, partial [Laminaria digitata]